VSTKSLLTSVLFLDMVQVFHVYLSPFRPTPAYLVTRIDLQQDPGDGLYRIAKLVYYYQPEDTVRSTLPLLAGLVGLFKSFSTVMSCIGALVSQVVLGWWNPGSGRRMIMAWAHRDWFWRQRSPVTMARASQ